MAYAFLSFSNFPFLPRFYVEVEEDCCRDLDRVSFPVYQPQQLLHGHPSSATSLIFRGSRRRRGKGEEDDEQEEDEEEGDPSEEKRPEHQQTLADLATTSKGLGLARSSSSLSPLDGVPTATAALGRLPTFPSWSLMHLGSSYLYSHSSGVNQVLYRSVRYIVEVCLW